MSRSSHDFDFRFAELPCGRDTCIKNAPVKCAYYKMCDLAIKKPPAKPEVDHRKIKKLSC